METLPEKDARIIPDTYCKQLGLPVGTTVCPDYTFELLFEDATTIPQAFADLVNEPLLTKINIPTFMHVNKAFGFSGFAFSLGRQMNEELRNPDNPMRQLFCTQFPDADPDVVTDGNNAIVRWIGDVHSKAISDLYNLCELIQAPEVTDKDFGEPGPSLVHIVVAHNSFYNGQTDDIICTANTKEKAQQIVCLLNALVYTHYSDSDLKNHLPAWIVNKATRKNICNSDETGFRVVSKIPHFIGNVLDPVSDSVSDADAVSDSD